MLNSGILYHLYGSQETYIALSVPQCLMPSMYPSNIACTTHSLPQSSTILQPHKHPILSHSLWPYCTIFQYKQKDGKQDFISYKNRIPSHSSPNILLHSQGLSNILHHSHRPRMCGTIPVFPGHLVLFQTAHLTLLTRLQIPDGRVTQ